VYIQKCAWLPFSRNRCSDGSSDGRRCPANCRCGTARHARACSSSLHVRHELNHFKSRRSGGVEVDANNVAKFLKEVEGKSVDELIAAGREKLASMPAGGGAAPSGGGAGTTAGAAAVEEEKKVEEESEEEVRR
jgi:ribosomal protein L12E/L44/L45/RPP1/RPP2